MPIFKPLAFVCAMLAPAAAAAGQPHLATSSPRESLTHFLQRYLRQVDGSEVDTTTRISTASVPLGGASHEVLVYVTGSDWCGSGGCRLFVLQFDGSRYRVIGKTAIVQLPVRILDTRSHGHPDIGVFVAGGGIEPGYEAALSFDGRAYPSNPSVPPARPLAGTSHGRTIISATATGKRLY